MGNKMNEEIKEKIDDLKRLNDYYKKKEHNYAFPDYYSLNYEDLDILLNYITNLQEELKSANESINWWTNRFKAVEKENQKLNKIIDELEKWLKEKINRYEYSTGNMNMAAAGTLKATLNKLTELKKEVE